MNSNQAVWTSRWIAALVLSAATSHGCAAGAAPYESRPDKAAQETTSMTQDKKDVIDFLRRFRHAVEADAFAEPATLKAALNLEVLEMRPVDGYTIPKGAPPSAERSKYVSQSLRDIKTNVRVIDELREEIRYFVRTAGLDVGRWSFGIDKLHEKICITPVEIELLYGKRNLDLPLPSHPPADYVMPDGYKFETARGLKSAQFTYRRVAGGMCVTSFGAGFQP